MHRESGRIVIDSTKKSEGIGLIGGGDFL